MSTQEKRKPTKSTTIQLSQPVKQGSELVKEMTFSPVRGNTFRRIKSSELTPGTILEIAGWLTGFPDSVFDKLETTDIGEVMFAVQEQLAVLNRAAKLAELQAIAAAGGSPPKPAKPPIHIPLCEPVTVGRDDDAETIDSITLGALTGKMMRTLPAGDLGPAHVVAVVEKLMFGAQPQPWTTAKIREVVDKLNPADLSVATGVAEDFLVAVQTTGVGRRQP